MIPLAFTQWSEYKECSAATHTICLGHSVVRWFHNFVQKLIPDEGRREYILKWVAHMVQKTHLRPETCIFLHSEEGGVGKNVFTEILQCLVGTLSSAGGSRIKRILEGGNGDGFTEENDKVLLVVDEVDPRRINYDQINNLCTSSHLTVRCLYKEPRHVANATRLIMTSNFRPEQGCKGNQILHVECDPYWAACTDHVRNAQFVTELLDTFGVQGRFSKHDGEHNRGNMAWIGQYFLTMDIGGFDATQDMPL